MKNSAILLFKKASVDALDSYHGQGDEKRSLWPFMGIRRREPLVGRVRPAAIATSGYGYRWYSQRHGDI
jgi:hypothetical protein